MRSISGFQTVKGFRNQLVRLSAWVVIAWEKLWPLLVPMAMVLSLFLIFTWIGGWLYLQSQENIVFLSAVQFLFGIAFIGALLPLWNFSRPAQEELTRRIEIESKLEHRPLSAQEDALTFGQHDRTTALLWQAHQTQLANQTHSLTSGSPAPKANRFDPFALRAMLPITVFAAFCFSFSTHGGKIADLYEKRFSAEEFLTRMDAWISPPKYTRKPPIFLTREANTLDAVSVPTGSEFFLRFIGKNDVTVIQRAGETETVIQPETGIETVAEQSDYRLRLENDSVLELVTDDTVLASWSVAVIADEAPTVTFQEQPRAALSGSLELTYSVADDYGVVGAEGFIEPLEKGDAKARPLYDAPKLTLPLPRSRAKKGIAKYNKDLTQHPWAASRVKLHLEVYDDLDQIGRTETREITLPGRNFTKPLAQAIVEQRQILAMDANQQKYVADLLDAVASAPPEFIDNANAIMGMSVAHRRLRFARTDDDLRDALDLMWEIALAVEFGDLTEAERKLREAQEALSRALEEGATDEEIERLMKELRQAMDEMLQSLMEQARRNPQTQNPFEQNDQMQMLSQNDLERMMDQIENLAKSGSQDAARQMLSELQRMMDNLRSGQHQQQRQAEGNQFNQALDKLSEMMREQERLLNETYRMQRQQQEGLRQNPQNGQNQQGQQRSGNEQNGQQQQGNQQGDPNNQNPGGQMTREEFAEALRQLQQQQDALQQQLSELGKQLESLGLGQSEELGEAQGQMGEAGENLSGQRPGAAANNQGRALEALRQGAQNMMQQMAGDRQQGGEQQSDQNGQGGAQSARTGTDPLGRREGDGQFDSDVQIPGEINAQRAREILEAIRKRLAIPENPLIEKDYLERLLNSE